VPDTGLPAVRFGKARPLSVGQLVVSFGVGPHPLYHGVIGALHVKNSGTTAYLPVRCKAAPEGMHGVTFASFLPAHRQIDETRGLLKAGDLITHLDGIPTPSMDEFVRVGNKRTAALGAIAGEWVKLSIQRDGKKACVYLPLVDGTTSVPAVWKLARWNVRRSGFPEVFSHDSGVPHDLCGGPVVDRFGAVLGVNIARASTMETYAIPGDAVQTVIAELSAGANSPAASAGLATRPCRVASPASR
jgi:S1-C subfamily serine protease